ncbi:hypothetical protein RHOFW510R12_26470 [Rhodanobacter sp. FW510-R12]
MAALAMAIPAVANATGAAAGSHDFTGNWPTHYVFDDGTDLGLTLKYQYDVDRFSMVSRTIQSLTCDGVGSAISRWPSHWMDEVEALYQGSGELDLDDLALGCGHLTYGGVFGHRRRAGKERDAHISTAAVLCLRYVSPQLDILPPLGPLSRVAKWLC